MELIERLEQRALFAGNVSVKFVGDQLRLTGDGEDNVFTVAESVEGTVDSTLFITGLNGTTIDGKAAFIATVGRSLPLHYSSIKIATGDGNDSVAINPSFNAISFSVDLGGGDDSFGGDQRFFRAVDIFGGEGRDRISLVGEFEGRVRIFPGGGRDRTNLEGVARRGFEIDDSGSGGFTNVSITSRRASSIALGNAADRLTITNGRFTAPLTVFAKGGDDQITIDGFIANTPCTVNGGAGDDDFNLLGERINLVVVE